MRVRRREVISPPETYTCRHTSCISYIDSYSSIHLFICSSVHLFICSSPTRTGQDTTWTVMHLARRIGDPVSGGRETMFLALVLAQHFGVVLHHALQPSGLLEHRACVVGVLGVHELFHHTVGILQDLGGRQSAHIHIVKHFTAKCNIRTCRYHSLLHVHMRIR